MPRHTEKCACKFLFSAQTPNVVANKLREEKSAANGLDLNILFYSVKVAESVFYYFEITRPYVMFTTSGNVEGFLRLLPPSSLPNVEKKFFMSYIRTQ